MPRITKKGQITIPKHIRDRFNIKPHDIGNFKVKEGNIIFTVKKGTILNANRKKVKQSFNIKKVREKVETEIAEKAVGESK